MRVWIFGAPGAGKSTLACHLSNRFSLPQYQLDDEFWRPNWRPAPAHAFTQAVAAHAAQDAWIIDGSYTLAEPLLQQRATHVLWLDLPLSVSYPRLLKRTFLRVWRGDACCGGNRETLREVFDRDSLLLYALRRHAKIRQRAQTYWNRCTVSKIRLTHASSVVDEATAFCMQSRGNQDSL